MARTAMTVLCDENRKCTSGSSPIAISQILRHRIPRFLKIFMESPFTKWVEDLQIRRPEFVYVYSVRVKFGAAAASKKKKNATLRPASASKFTVLTGGYKNK